MQEPPKGGDIPLTDRRRHKFYPKEQSLAFYLDMGQSAAVIYTSMKLLSFPLAQASFKLYKKERATFRSHNIPLHNAIFS